MGSLSGRISHLSESETLKMSKLSRELNAKGFDVINLSLGEPDFPTPTHIKEAAKKAIDENYSYYTPVAGYQDLREAVCAKFKRENGLSYSPAEIIVSTGAKQSIYNAVLSIVNPGDDVILPAPYWVSYAEIVRMAEGNPVPVKTAIGNDFKITPAQLEKAITPRTRLIMFSSPCNPTGSVYSADELKDLAAVISMHPEIFVLSDEIYEHINFTGSHNSIASNDAIRGQVIIVNGVSKSFAMTGWRIGYLAGPVAVAAACEKIQGQVTSGASSISQRAALAAISSGNAPALEMRKSFLRRRDLVIRLLGEIPGMNLNIPQGAFYLFPEISSFFGKRNGNEKINNAGELCMYLLNHARVSLVAGDAFGAPEHIRFSYATSDERLTEAAARMQKALAELS